MYFIIIIYFRLQIEVVQYLSNNVLSFHTLGFSCLQKYIHPANKPQFSPVVR